MDLSNKNEIISKKDFCNCVNNILQVLKNTNTICDICVNPNSEIACKIWDSVVIIQLQLCFLVKDKYDYTGWWLENKLSLHRSNDKELNVVYIADKHKNKKKHIIKKPEDLYDLITERGVFSKEKD
jgi:hypothetical protein